MPKTKASKQAVNKNSPQCGLCGKRKNLVKTSCCGNWICDDEKDYVLFSYARNSCSRNHRRFTLCGYHEAEEHKGEWQTCKKCLHDFEHELEMYVWYGTNEYNFSKLKNSPVFAPTYCAKCGKRIVLPEGGYSVLCDVYRCDNCKISEKERKEIIANYNTKQKICLNKP